MDHPGRLFFSDQGLGAASAHTLSSWATSSICLTQSSAPSLSQTLRFLVWVYVSLSKLVSKLGQKPFLYVSYSILFITISFPKVWFSFSNYDPHKYMAQERIPGLKESWRNIPQMKLHLGGTCVWGEGPLSLLTFTVSSVTFLSTFDAAHWFIRSKNACMEQEKI